MLHLDLYPKYVTPFYGELLNLNFTSKSDEAIGTLFHSIQSIAKEINDETLITMLNATYRPSKVAAWIIGMDRRTHLIKELEFFLCKSGIIYTEHVLLNLLLLTGKKSIQTVIDFITQQIKFYLNQGNIIFLESSSIDWAISIVGYLDKTNNLNQLNHLYSSELWTNFEIHLQTFPPSIYKSIKLSLEPSFHHKQINRMMEIFNRTNKSEM
jgi:hypothetical protein